MKTFVALLLVAHCASAKIWEGSCGQLGSKRIVGGNDATAHSWPWQASLQQSTWWSSGHICGATLVHPQWAITAAHCVEGSSRNDLQVVFGEHDRTTATGREVTSQIQAIIQHENYDQNGDGFPYDIALLKLSEPVPLGRYIQPACMPKSSNQVFLNEECWISGWGSTQGGNDNSVLQELQIPVRTNSECANSWGANYIDDFHICIGNGDIGACNGDSGGPLQCNINGEWVLAGATSWGYSGCTTRGYPNVYARISFFLDWIENKVANN
ncbi:unnamed protein product [Owenia fusiformis]|uniref:Uncharacterized protein n=1 Tax=Owenia fusiformis TaxID=6347 RepID=A0A8J1XQN3_OWEFU|nr:unnamed protein product [Owenia fusiformis]